MLLSRALSLATVMLLVGCCTMGQVEAQENLDAGKSPSQIFGGTCTVCHKSPRGLLKKVPPGSLTAFLLHHCTTSPQMAGVLASYLISNGATVTRYGGGAQPKGGKDAKSGAKPASASEAPAALGELVGHPGYTKKRLARPAEAPDAVKPAAEGQAPAQEATEHGPDGGKLSAQQRPGKHGKPVPEEAPKPAEPPKEEASGGERAKTETKVESKQEGEGEATKGETGQPEGGKPAEDSSQSANAEPVKETEAPALRSDSVPAIAPAPTAPASSASSASPASAATGNSGSEPAAGTPAVAPEPPVSSPPAVTAPASPATSTSPASAAADNSGSEPAVVTPAVTPELSASPSPAVTASAPPQPPVAPAGPPAPPISK